MTDKRNESYFGKGKAPHTKIKHDIFQKILEISLSIANQLAPHFYKNNHSTSKTYTYIDLFAGSGSFKDGTKGSPILAFNSLSKHLETENNFNTLRMICTDKEETNIEKLTEELSKIKSENKIAEQIQIFTGIGDWEQYKFDIENKLTESGWGFVFADPFSTELDIKKMVTMLKKCSKFKDILVFFNYNTLARQLGRWCQTDIERLCRTLNLTKEDLIDQNQRDFSDKFKSSIKKALSHIKKMVKGVSIPITVESKLINADYFYLIFATDSFILVNNFIECFATMLTTYKNNKLSIEDSLNEFSFEDSIKENIKQKQEIYFYDLYDELTSDFLSWKNSSSNIKTIPTIKNIINIINKLLQNNVITVDCNKDFLYKRARENNQVGDIKSSVIKSAEAAKEIKLKYVSRN